SSRRVSPSRRPRDGRASSQPEIAQRKVIIRATAERPMIFAIALRDGSIIDAGDAKPHQAMLVEFPVLIAVTAEPTAAVILPLIGEAYRDAVLAKRRAPFSEGPDPANRNSQSRSPLREFPAARFRPNASPHSRLRR